MEKHTTWLRLEITDPSSALVSGIPVQAHFSYFLIVSSPPPLLQPLAKLQWLGMRPYANVG